MAKKNPATAITTRGATFQGKVVSVKARKTAVIARDYVRKVPKFERFEKRKSKVHAHVPDGLAVSLGDVVRVEECRKISKTKAHVVTKIIRAGA
ncbi:MAG: 30S ribosomal protein S17 [Candidatus Micrarchaeota archaeon]